VELALLVAGSGDNEMSRAPLTDDLMQGLSMALPWARDMALVMMRTAPLMTKIWLRGTARIHEGPIECTRKYNPSNEEPNQETVSEDKFCQQHPEKNNSPNKHYLGNISLWVMVIKFPAASQDSEQASLCPRMAGKHAKNCSKHQNND
jgi:hypothetical protein